MANWRCARFTTPSSIMTRSSSRGRPCRLMAVAKHIQVYDTTLRDGCQSEDVSMTVADKVQVAERLDDLGFDYIEGGWPGSNDRDAAFFREIRKVRLRDAEIAAFGSTRRANIRAAQDRNLQLLLRAETPVATVVG